jgi:hypothetical protein
MSILGVYWVSSAIVARTIRFGVVVWARKVFALEFKL